VSEAHADDVPGTRVDVTALPLDPRPIGARVSVDRMRASIERVATGPRHVVEDHDRALVAAAFVRDELNSLGLRVEEQAVAAEGVVLPAVWATIPGLDPGRSFVLAAHYDTVVGSPGADDNASGVAGVLELARVLRGYELPMSVILAAVPFEEPGLPFAGAAALADVLVKRGEVSGMISLEMIGFTSDGPDGFGQPAGNYLIVAGDANAEGLVHTVHSAAAVWGAGVPVFPAVLETGEGSPVIRSDHVAFWAHGVPAAMATDTAEFRNPNYHQATDTPETLDLAFAAACVRALLMGTVAYTSLCARDGRPVLRA
jgi:hypothetical protein